MIDGLESMFEGIDLAGIVDDVKEYGVMGASAVAATIGWKYVDGLIAGKVPSIPKIARDLAPIAVGVAAGHFLSKYNRQVAIGAAIGLVAQGVSNLVVPHLPGSLKGLGAGEDDPFARYLDGAPSTSEEIHGAPATSEEVSGAPLAAFGDVEEIQAGSGVSSLHGFGAAATLM